MSQVVVIAGIYLAGCYLGAALLVRLVPRCASSRIIRRHFNLILLLPLLLCGETLSLLAGVARQLVGNVELFLRRGFEKLSGRRLYQRVKYHFDLYHVRRSMVRPAWQDRVIADALVEPAASPTRQLGCDDHERNKRRRRENQPKRQIDGAKESCLDEIAVRKAEPGNQPFGDQAPTRKIVRKCGLEDRGNRTIKLEPQPTGLVRRLAYDGPLSARHFGYSRNRANFKGQCDPDKPSMRDRPRRRLRQPNVGGEARLAPVNDEPDQAHEQDHGSDRQDSGKNCFADRPSPSPTGFPAR